MKIIKDVSSGFYPANEYPAKIICENCSRVFYIAIPKGTTILAAIEHEECPNCGCKNTLKPMS